MSKFTTLSQIASKAGVAPSTVSRALADNPRISKSTRDKIKEIANKLGYSPNRYSQVLKDNKTYLIGVIIPDLTLHFYSRVLKAINEHFVGSEYVIVLGNSTENVENEKAIVDRFIFQRVDGVIAALSKESKDVAHFQKLIEQGIPLVFFDRVANFLNVPKIISDDYQAAYNATEHLIKSGCKTIAHITASKNLNNSNNRLYGYMDALKAHNRPVNEDLIFYFEFDHTTIQNFLDKTLKEYPELDGIFVFNDYVANTAVHHLLQIGKKIPTEISVIGFSNEPIASYMTPKLSTVEDVATSMGERAANVLHDYLLDPNLKMNSDKVVIHQELVLKETTR